jgi:hypothetical protein
MNDSEISQPASASVRSSAIRRLESLGFSLPLAFVMLYALSVFLVAYFSDVNRPGVGFPNGWYQYNFDQSKYFDMVKSIPKGNLGEFRYPPVYPFLGFLGGLFYSSDPFFLVDCLLFVVFAGYTYSLLSGFLDSPLSVVGALVVAHSSVALFVMPWTSTVSAPCLCFILYRILRPPYTLRGGLAVGLAVGLMFGARIGDGLIGGLVVAAVAIDWWLSRAETKRFMAGILLGGAVLVAMVVAVNLKFTHLLLGDYTKGILSQDFYFYAIPFKLYGYALSAMQFHGEWQLGSKTLFQVLPLWIVFPLGLTYLIVDRRSRRMGIAFLAALVGWLVIYAPFVATTGLSLKYGSLHYSKLLFPILVGCALKVFSMLTDRSAEGQEKEGSHVLLLGMSPTRAAMSYLVCFVLLLSGIMMVRFPMIDLSHAAVTANRNPGQARNAIDGNPATRWDTAQTQASLQTFDLDFGRNALVARIVLDTAASPNDTPRTLLIYASKDLKNWRRLVCENQSMNRGVGDYYTDLSSMRYIRFEQSGTDAHAYWSIHEMRLYGW